MDSCTRERPPSADAVEFVRFCHRRRRVGWPELYDEMCAVAHRGLYRGWGTDELGAEGIGFGLFQMPALAALVGQVIAEEQERGRRAHEQDARRPEEGRAEPQVDGRARPKLRYVGAAAGA